MGIDRNEFGDPQFADRFRDKWFGKYRAFVRDNCDPERRGRVRMEIPAVLGTGDANLSPWADACTPYGGNPDAGAFMIPDVGASVWAEFEGGDTNYPIWTGAWFARSDPGEIPDESARTCEQAYCADCEDKARCDADSAEKAIHAQYHGGPPYSCPRMRVIVKTETGHTILADDRDGTERLELIDRSGQSLRFDGPVKPEKQKGNALPRGTANAQDGTQLDVANDIVADTGGISLVDLAGQRLVFEAWVDKQKIYLRSGSSDSRWQEIVIDNTVDAEQIRITGVGAFQELVIDSTPDAQRVHMFDAAGSEIMMDAQSGNIMIRPANMFVVEAKPVAETGDGSGGGNAT